MYRGGCEVWCIRIAECVQIRVQKFQGGQSVDGAVKGLIPITDLLPGLNEDIAATSAHENFGGELAEILLGKAEIGRDGEVHAAGPRLDECEPGVQRIFRRVNANVDQVCAVSVPRA